MQQQIQLYFNFSTLYYQIPCKCQQEGADKFIEGLFGECEYNSKQVCSYIFGWISIFCWICAQYPQVRLNILLRKSESLSHTFLLLWLSGDICNLVSSILLQQLPTQIYLGIYWMCFDAILLTTHFYFVCTKKQYDPHPHGTNFSKTEIAVYIIIFVIIINNLIWAGMYNEDLLQFQPEKYQYCHEDSDLSHSSVQYIIGNICAYITIVLYSCSRPTQIYKNYKLKQKCIKNLSITMFYFTSAGNITQLISMIVFSQDKDYLIQKIPFILSALIPATCDIIVITQYYTYKKLLDDDTDQERQHLIEDDQTSEA